MRRQLFFHGGYFFELIEEPGIDSGHLVQLFDRHALMQRVAKIHEPLGMRRDQALREDPRLNLLRPDFLSRLERAHAFHQRFFECAPDGHGLADRLHLRS